MASLHPTIQNYFKRERCLYVDKFRPAIFTALSLCTLYVWLILILYTRSPLPLDSDSSTEFSRINKAADVAPPPLPAEDENCDLFRGHWVPAVRGNYYTNSSCTTIPESKNCFKNGRMNSDFLNWRWKPDHCDLPALDPKTFLDAVRGKKMAFVGDSLARNQMESLLCLLAQEEIPNDLYKDSEDRFRKWFFPKHNFTLIKLWSKFLVDGEERVMNGTGSGIFDLHLDKVDHNWADDLPKFDYVIISDGHWFFRRLYLYQAGKLHGCVYCPEPNITHFNVDVPFRMAFRTAFEHIHGCKNCSKNMITFFRTFAPSHFKNGAWNTGGYCNETSLVGEEEVEFEGFDWKLRNIQIEEFERAREEGLKHGKRFELVDITRAFLMRPDAHPGEFWGNKWMRGYNDCTHWCLPGPIDVWNELLLAVLKRKSPQIRG